MKLNYKSFGSGPALIILHGLFGSLDNWQTLARRFGEHFSTFIVDQRNHGKSPHDDEMNYEVMADDLAEFMDDHGIHRANLIGHSMGGKTVMQFGIGHADRIDKMVVADMSPVRYEGHHHEILAALRELPMSEMSDRKEVAAWLEGRIKTKSTRQFILKSLGRDENGGFRWKFNFPVIDRAYEDILDKIEPDFEEDFPVLFIRGEKSDYVKDEYHELIRSYYSNVKFETIKGAGHWLHADSPDEFAERVLDFLLN